MLTDNETRTLLLEADVWWRENSQRFSKPSSMDTNGHCDFTNEPEFAHDRKLLLSYPALARLR